MHIFENKIIFTEYLKLMSICLVATYCSQYKFPISLESVSTCPGNKTLQLDDTHTNINTKLRSHTGHTCVIVKCHMGPPINDLTPSISVISYSLGPMRWPPISDLPWVNVVKIISSVLSVEVNECCSRLIVTVWLTWIIHGWAPCCSIQIILR